MKKKYIFINLSLMVIVLVTMLIQSMHSFGHLHQLFSEKECHHKYTGQTELSHQHHPFDKCFACEFTLSNFLGHQVFSCAPRFALLFIPSSFLTPNDLVFSFSGSFYSLRGPPNLLF